MADAGAQRIADLLDRRSSRLAKGTQTMVAGLAQREGDDDFKVRPKAYDGLDEMRRYYRDLRRNVEQVNTRSTAAKKAVVDALALYSVALAEFDHGLQGQFLSDPVDQLSRAASIARRAAANLDKARDRL